MSEIAGLAGSTPRAALSRLPLPLWLGVLALALIVGSVAFLDHLAGRAALTAGLTLGIVSGGIAVWTRRHPTDGSDSWTDAAQLVDRDPVACFGTDLSGVIGMANPAARAKFPRTATSLAGVLDPLFANAQEAVARLAARALDKGSAADDMHATRGALRLTVHRLPQDRLLWRVEEQLNATAPDGSTATDLPMMRVAHGRKIVQMNDAMATLLGGRPTALDRIVTQLPLRSGQAAQFQTPSGQTEAHLAVIDLPDAEQMVYVWPEATPAGERANADAIPVPLMRISPSGRILMSNAKAQKLLMIEDGVDLDFAQVIEGLGRPIDEWLRDVADGRGSGRTEVVRAARPSHDVYLQVSLGRMVERGEVSILAVLIDATELKTLEAQFVQSQKMQAIGQLAGGVAHDFNNLLTAISGHCDLLLLRHEPGDPNYGDLIQINQNANRAASLVGQLLAFSRKQNLKPEMIDLRETLVDLTHLLNRLVGEKINLRWSHDPDLPRVRADKRQLEQVIMNLVVNARDAMPSGGTISVETTNERLNEPLFRDRAEVPAGEYIIVKVRDEGCGIAPDKLQKIFEPFYSTKKTGEGTGLGLSMAYGIVKQSGGYIFADSVVGKGSSFTMYLPAHHEVEVQNDRSAEAAARQVPHQDGGHVLLVEDEAPVRAFAGRALRLRGYTVTEAVCAEDALEMLEDPDLKVDVFVTDVVMPGMDGPTWVSKAMEARPDVKVVFVSGYAEDSVTHNRAKIPNSAFLPKPFSLNQLTEMVQSQLT
ncbi:MAG: ATP-binding protein [Pseudomonadota bacterium]